MKFFRLSVILVLASVTIGNCQKVEILLRDGTKLSEEIRANSETQVFLKGRTLNYSDILSIRFDSDTPSDKKLQQRLAIAGVKIFIREHEQIIDVGYVNDSPQKGDKKIILFCIDSLEILYKRIGQHLALKGYGIEDANKDFLTFKTALRETSKLNFSYVLNVIVIEHTVNITAQLKLNNSFLAGTQESGLMDWEYTHEKEGTFAMTASSVLYNDLIRNLSDFRRLNIQYE
jgi:hypothetical protein